MSAAWSRFPIACLAALALAGCASADYPNNVVDTYMFEPSALDHLHFLEGRWTGAGPDGQPFYEAYRRADANTLITERYGDASFERIVDGSTVSWEDGVITSRWGDFSWRAEEIRPGFAQFAPIDAPSTFTWRRVDAETTEVTQHWTDENGVEQSYELELKRID